MDPLDQQPHNACNACLFRREQSIKQSVVLEHPSIADEKKP
jgi:hypothetical protein